MTKQPRPTTQPWCQTGNHQRCATQLANMNQARTERGLNPTSCACPCHVEPGSTT